MNTKLRLAQIQLKVCEDKEENLRRLEAALDSVMAGKPDMAAVGEMFCCPYETALFPQYAEPEGGPTWRALSRMAAERGIYLSAGSVPESDSAGRVYNTAYVFDRAGRQIAKHRKMHLFDVDIRGGQWFKESETLTAGDAVTVFDMEFGKMGLCICFDIRFPELGRLMALAGAKLILVPAAFNGTTGPAHWELNFRSRALDNQCFYAGTSDALTEGAGYQSWGHSILVSPWGDVLGQLGRGEGTMVHEIDLSYADDVRKQLPLLSARRGDIYRLETAEGPGDMPLK